jgi:hypothetical protein
MSISSIDLHSSKSTIRLLYGIQIRAHGWPRNRSHGFALEVGSYCSWKMRPGVVIHIHRPCSRRMQAREPPVQSIRQLEAALHREWQQLSQQDIRCLTGGKAVTALERWGLALSSIYTGLVASGWLSKWGTTTGCKTSLIYWSLVRLPCMVTKSSLL